MVMHLIQNKPYQKVALFSKDPKTSFGFALVQNIFKDC